MKNSGSSGGLFNLLTIAILGITFCLVGAFALIFFVPGVLPEIKKIIRSLTYTDMVMLARQALGMPTAEKVEACLETFLKKYCPDIPLDTEIEK